MSETYLVCRVGRLVFSRTGVYYERATWIRAGVVLTPWKVTVCMSDEALATWDEVQAEQVRFRRSVRVWSY